MRSPKKRSLLSVNEHFEGEHNDKIHFLFSLILCRYHILKLTNRNHRKVFENLYLHYAKSPLSDRKG